MTEPHVSSRVYLSSGALRTNLLHEVVERVIASDVRRLELSSGLKARGDVDAALKRLDDAAVDLLLHNYFPPPRDSFVLNLASPDAESLERSREHCRRAIDLSRRVDAPFYSVHSGFCVALSVSALGRPSRQLEPPGDLHEARTEGRARFMESVVDLAQYAQSRGVDLLLENNVVTEAHVVAGTDALYLMSRSNEILEFLEEVGDVVGLLLDLGHLNVSARALGLDPLEELQALCSAVGALHVSDNDGETDNNQPIREDSWFADHLADFQNIPVVLEAYDLDPEVLREQMALLGSLLRRDRSRPAVSSTGV